MAEQNPYSRMPSWQGVGSDTLTPACVHQILCHLADTFRPLLLRCWDTGSVYCHVWRWPTASWQGAQCSARLRRCVACIVALGFAWCTPYNSCMCVRQTDRTPCIRCASHPSKGIMSEGRQHELFTEQMHGIVPQYRHAVLRCTA